MQNFAAKIIDGKARKFDHVTPILKELKWLTIKNQIYYDTVITVYRNLRRLCAEHIPSFPSVNTITHSNTRQRSNLYIPKVNTDSGARALSVRGPKLFNDLPQNVKESHNITTFKTRIYNHLLNNS